MVTTDWHKFFEYKANGLVKDVFSNQSQLDALKGGRACTWCTVLNLSCPAPRWPPLRCASWPPVPPAPRLLVSRRQQERRMRSPAASTPLPAFPARRLHGHRPC